MLSSAGLGVRDAQAAFLAKAHLRDRSAAPQSQQRLRHRQLAPCTRAVGKAQVERPVEAEQWRPEQSQSAAGSYGAPARRKAAGTSVLEVEGSASASLVKMLEEVDAMGHSDTDLQSRPVHYLWVASASLALLALLAQGLAPSSNAAEWGTCGLAAVLGYLVADMATGFYHFGVDNYGNAETPVFGNQIDAFQGHHRRPWTITKRQFANNLHALARPVFFTTAILLLLPLGAAQDVFAAVFFACVMLSQQFHAWAHTPKPLLPSAVIALQDAGLLVSRKMHGAHHRPPFSSNYCIVSGLANGPLDGLGVFPALEKLIFKTTGTPPRSWSDTAQEMLSNDVAYYEDGTNTVD